ncbi:MAG TPA: hypothetical protein VE439_09210, partial [Anaerolineae bacterium]|nr:hypothetical protein [Anaerolineae bacterium]
IFHRQVKRTNAKHPRDIEHLHLSWGYKGKDFDITRDGRVHIFVGNYEVAHEPLPYRIIFKLHLLVNAKDFVCYESKPNKEVYVKASELLKTAN